MTLFRQLPDVHQRGQSAILRRKSWTLNPATEQVTYFLSGVF